MRRDNMHPALLTRRNLHSHYSTGTRDTLGGGTFTIGGILEITHAVSCTVAGCDRKHKGHGYCETHLYHWRAGKELKPLGAKKTELPIARELECSFRMCSRPQLSKGLCARHWMQQNKGNALSPVKERYSIGDKCAITGCENTYQLKGDLNNGRCPRHKRMSRYGITNYQIEQIEAIDECSICLRKDGPMHIDHDHSCCPPVRASVTGCGNCIRGVICAKCNKALGLMADSKETLARAIQYLNGENGLWVNGRPDIGNVGGE